MSDVVRARMDLLERAVLELGAELFSLKGSMAKHNESHGKFLAIIKGLKLLFDDKGLVTSEDFEAAVELGEALERANPTMDHGLLQELEKLKKIGH